MRTETLKLIAVSSEEAAGSVTRLLKAVDGVGAVSVSLARNEVNVQFDEKVASVKNFQSALVGAGYGIDVAEAVRGKNGSCCGGCGG